MRQVAATLVKKAKAGDLVAAKLLLQYSVGLPTAAPDHDKANLDEIRLVMAGPALVDVLRIGEEGGLPAVARRLPHSSSPSPSQGG
jgi:hypothetical protein